MKDTRIWHDYGRLHLVFFGEHCVQTIERDMDLWFLAEDLGRMLELANIRKNIQELKDDEKDWCYAWTKEKWPTAEDVFREKKEGSSVTNSYRRPQRQRVRVVNEAGLYRLILMSRTPAAKRFQDLVVREILPAIRKTGRYVHRMTTPLAFKPADMSGLEMTRIDMRERPRQLEWPVP
jgi:prophage antirepressor-like protein